jgi:hypothetical protein
MREDENLSRCAPAKFPVHRNHIQFRALRLFFYAQPVRNPFQVIKRRPVFDGLLVAIVGCNRAGRIIGCGHTEQVKNVFAPAVAVKGDIAAHCAYAFANPSVANDVTQPLKPSCLSVDFHVLAACASKAVKRSARQ